MGSNGGSAPNGLTRREARTLFLRAPEADWTALTEGYKEEFRIPHRGEPVSSSVRVPTPVVLYAVSSRRLRRQLMVLTDHRVERLLDIDGDTQGLMRAGFESYDHFRTYWRRRTRRPWRPLAKVEVFTLREFLVRDKADLGSKLVDHLYGEFM